MEEIWKDVVGYEGKYMVSNLGDVKSLNYRKTAREKMLKTQSVRHGYLQVRLSLNGKIKFFYVHRLVAAAFLENQENLLEVNHINECKTDNRVENLEWCTHEYNIQYSMSKSGKKRIPKLGYITCVPVTCVELKQTFPSAIDAERITLANNSHILKCCKGIRKTAGGYHWRFAEV